jgi:biopolymer transport protein TolR
MPAFTGTSSDLPCPLHARRPRAHETSSRTAHQLRLISEISIMPFMDVVLVLLFVFVLAAPLAQNQSPPGSLQPNLPPLLRTPAPAERVTLLVNRDLSVTLNGAMLARAALPFSLKQIETRAPGTGVEVRMHRDLPVQQLVEIMGMLEAAGIRKTAVTTHADEPLIP